MSRLCFARWLPSRRRVISAEDDIDIEWVELEAAAVPASLYGCDECRTRTDDWAEHDVTPLGHIE
jgi:hypothetical protein